MKQGRLRHVALVLAGTATLLALGLTGGLLVALAHDPPSARPVAAAVGAGDERLSTLPLFEYPPRPDTARSLTIFYSGDNGWAKTDRGFADGVVADGGALIGVDSLRYFLHRRSAKDAAADLGAIIDHYSARWRPNAIVLAGYSYGANALPLIFAKLPAAARTRVKAVVLIAPDYYGRLVFRPYHWLDLPWPGSTPLSSALSSFAGLPTICVFGTLDRESSCPSLPANLVQIQNVPGKHKLKGAYGAVAMIIQRAASGAFAPHAGLAAKSQPIG